MADLSYIDADARFEEAIAKLKLGMKGGKKPQLNSMERQILEFCHGRDMKQYLKEEFEKHPIHLNEDGELIGENPFGKDRKTSKTFYDPVYGNLYTRGPIQTGTDDEKPYIYDDYHYDE